MKAARTIVNAILCRAMDRLQGASQEQIETAFRLVRLTARALGLPGLTDVDSVFIVHLVTAVARGMLNTPYGHPLDFDCPLIVTLSVTAYCPFKCINCYSHSGEWGKDSESGGILESAVNELASSQIPIVVITGGEPLATPLTRPTVEALAGAGKLVLLSTNASVEGHIDLIERYPLRFGFIFPIWGRRDRHNKLRGARSFERIEKNLELLNSRGKSGDVLVVLSEADMGVFDDLEQLVQRFRISRLRVTRKTNVGRQGQSVLTPDSAFERDLRHRLRVLKPHVGTVLVDIPEFRRHPKKSILEMTLGIAPYASCAAGNWMMHLDSNGAAYSCFTFEPSGRTYQVAPGLTLSRQWQQLKSNRKHLSNSEVCIGEHYSR